MVGTRPRGGSGSRQSPRWAAGAREECGGGAGARGRSSWVGAWSGAGARVRARSPGPLSAAATRGGVGRRGTGGAAEEGEEGVEEEQRLGRSSPESRPGRRGARTQLQDGTPARQGGCRGAAEVPAPPKPECFSSLRGNRCEPCTSEFSRWRRSWKGPGAAGVLDGRHAETWAEDASEVPGAKALSSGCLRPGEPEPQDAAGRAQSGHQASSPAGTQRPASASLFRKVRPESQLLRPHTLVSKCNLTSKSKSRLPGWSRRSPRVPRACATVPARDL